MIVKIFVSYSHQDAHYLKDDSLLGFLKGIKRTYQVDFWDDEKLVTGDDWNDKIKNQINKADIALVLVSQLFLDSPYCYDVEVSGFLKRARESGLIIFPIILSACNWKQHSWLKQRQFLPKGNKTIEEHYTEPGVRKRIFHEIREDLEAQITRKINPDNRAFDIMSAGVNVINATESQVKSVLTNAPLVLKEHSVMFEGADFELLARKNGRVIKTITYEEMKTKLSKDQLRHILLFEKPLRKYYQEFDKLYGQRINLHNGSIDKKVNEKLKNLVAGMKQDLSRIIAYLEQIGLNLEDHYAEIKHLFSLPNS